MEWEGRDILIDREGVGIAKDYWDRVGWDGLLSPAKLCTNKD
jgi:hypothetical protein